MKTCIGIKLSQLWISNRTALFVLTCSLLAAIYTHALGQITGLKPLRIDCGLSSSDFSRLNEDEAKAAFNVYAEIVGRDVGYDVEFFTTIYKDKQELSSALEKRQIELLSLEVVWYSAEEIGRYVTPTLVPEESPGVVLDTYVLLARRQEGPAALDDLRDATLLYIEHEDANLARIWLDVALMEHDLPSSEEYAGSVQKVHKSSSAVLPVFFGKVDACVVDRSSFKVMCDLNPQVGRILQIIAESEPVLDTVLCLNPSGSMNEKERHDLENALLRLHETPEGQQILTMFGITGFVPIREGHLDSALSLLHRHGRMRGHEATPADGLGE